MELSYIVSQKYPHINQKNYPISIFKFSIKNDFSTLTLAPPENHVKIFKNQKSNTRFDQLGVEILSNPDRSCDLLFGSLMRDRQLSR